MGREKEDPRPRREGEREEAQMDWVGSRGAKCCWWWVGDDC